MCIDSSSLKNQDLSLYRDFWNGMERNNTDLAVSRVKHSFLLLLLIRTQ